MIDTNRFQIKHGKNAGLYLQPSSTTHWHEDLIEELNKSSILIDNIPELVSRYISTNVHEIEHITNTLSPAFPNQDLAHILGHHYYFLGNGLTFKIAVNHAINKLENTYLEQDPAGYSNQTAYVWSHLNPKHIIAINLRDRINHSINQVFLFHHLNYDPITTYTKLLQAS